MNLNAGAKSHTNNHTAKVGTHDGTHKEYRMINDVYDNYNYDGDYDYNSDYTSLSVLLMITKVERQIKCENSSTRGIIEL